MKYVSVDIETTGLNPNKDQILMVAMLVEDTKLKLPREELPTFACYVKHERYEGDAFALWMNSWIFEKLAKGNAEYPIYRADWTEPWNTWNSRALDFLRQHFGDKKVVAAGKNFGKFDLQFFPSALQNKFSHRSIDPGSIFVDWDLDELQSLGDIKKKLNIEKEVSHNAVDDAWDVIQVLRTTY